MLSTQLLVEFFLKLPQLPLFIVVAGYSFPLTLALGGAGLDEMFNVIVVNVIWCRVTGHYLQLRAIGEASRLTRFPERNGSLLKGIAVLHVRSRLLLMLGKRDRSHYGRIWVVIERKASVAYPRR